MVSISFCQRLRGRGARDMRINCMLIVLPPLTTWPAAIFCRKALPKALKSTPQCLKKRLSSNWVSAKTYFSGMLSGMGKRH